VYPSAEFKAEIIDIFFPSDTLSLTKDLSSMSGAYYGLLLKTIGEEFGSHQINKISEKIFFELGKQKAQQAIDIYPMLPRDTRAFAIILVSAIYNSSPEFNFEIIKYRANQTMIEVHGIDRYLRVLTQLGIEGHVTFPTLLPFLKGIREYLNIKCKITHHFQKLLKKSETMCIFNFTAPYV
jgi:hypothetical protein